MDKVNKKRKYWYKTNTHTCVLCGKERVLRERVFNKSQKGTHWHDTACSDHFLMA